MNTNYCATPPLVEPVTLAEFKGHAKIDETTDDALCSALLKAAREWCEQFTRRAFIAQTWVVGVSQMPVGNAITLPRGPVLSILDVKLFDDADNATIWPALNYYAALASHPARLVLRTGASWPVLMRTANAMQISYVAGYGVAAGDVPEAIRLAIKQLALHWYEYRGEALASSAMASAPLTIEALLQPYRALKVGLA